MKNHNKVICLLFFFTFWSKTVKAQYLFGKYNDSLKKYALCIRIYPDDEVRILSKYIYDYLPLREHPEKLLASANGKWFFIDKRGKVIGDSADYIDPTCEGEEDYVPIFNKGHWTVLNNKGKRMAPKKIPDSLFFYNLSSPGGCFYRKGKDFYCFQGDENKLKIIEERNNPYWDGTRRWELLFLLDCRTTPCPAKREKWGYIDQMGKEKIPFIFSSAGHFSISIAVRDLASVTINGKAGFIDTAGVFVIDPVYEEAGDFTSQLAPVKLDGQWGCIDTLGKVVIDFIYDEMYNFCNEKIVVRKGAKWGALDEKGTVVIPFEYDMLPTQLNGNKICVKNSKYGVIDESGRPFLPFEFEQLRNSRVKKDYIYIAAKDGKWGLILENGKIALPFEYDYININNQFEYAELTKNKTTFYFIGPNKPILDKQPK